MKKKIIFAGLSLSLALILLTTASFAWFTLSAKPEISGMQLKLYTDRTLLLSETGGAGTFTQYLSLSDQFEGMAPLHPVSTADGIHWIIPTYETSTGSLQEVENFLIDDSLSYANSSCLDADGSMLTGKALQDAQEAGYYVWADFWMMTEEENGCRVRLSIPHEGADLSDEQSAGVYGTYVLGIGTLDENDPTKVNAGTSRPETCMRVGFLVYQDSDGDGAEETDFIIYEPNADRRSLSTKPVNAAGETGNNYIVGYEFSNADYADGKYYVTEPIGVRLENPEESGAAETLVPAVTDFDEEKLIVQEKSAWNQTALAAALAAEKTPDSNAVASFGSFYETDEDFTQTGENGGNRSFLLSGKRESIAGSCVIAALKENEPVRVRLFVWIEGQDIDCWNDVAAGSFLVNLELAGETIPEEEALS